MGVVVLLMMFIKGAGLVGNQLIFLPFLSRFLVLIHTLHLLHTRGAVLNHYNGMV